MGVGRCCILDGSILEGETSGSSVVACAMGVNAGLVSPRGCVDELAQPTPKSMIDVRLKKSLRIEAVCAGSLFIANEPCIPGGEDLTIFLLFGRLWLTNVGPEKARAMPKVAQMRPRRRYGVNLAEEHYGRPMGQPWNPQDNPAVCVF